MVDPLSIPRARGRPRAVIGLLDTRRRTVGMARWVFDIMQNDDITAVAMALYRAYN